MLAMVVVIITTPAKLPFAGPAPTGFSVALLRIAAIDSPDQHFVLCLNFDFVNFVAVVSID